MKRKDKIMIGIASAIGAWLFLHSCAVISEKAKPIEHFDINRYLGAWYEIARFDYRFEKHLNNVSAQYSLDKNGNVSVLNSGFNFKKGKWVKADGVAKFRGDKNIASLKVSFFRPFYAGYHVVALDKNYQYALVAGKNLDYLWILSREKSIPMEVKTDYLQIAKDIGYDTAKLIWVKHDRNDNPFLHEK